MLDWSERLALLLPGGFEISPEKESHAIASANTVFHAKLQKHYPMAWFKIYGSVIGLLSEQIKGLQIDHVETVKSIMSTTSNNSQSAFKPGRSTYRQYKRLFCLTLIPLGVLTILQSVVMSDRSLMTIY